MIKIEACFFWQKFIIALFKARDVCEAGVVDQGVARDVHGHRRPGREPGRDGEQVQTASPTSRSDKTGKSLRIDAHVESAVEYTTRATNDTKKALEYQQKARR